MLAGLGAFVFAIVILVRPLKATWFNQRGRAVVPVLAGIVLVTIASHIINSDPKEQAKIAAAEASQSAQQATEESAASSSSSSSEVQKLQLASADSCINKVDVTKPAVNVDCFRQNVWSDQDIILMAGATSKNVGQQVQKGASEAKGMKWINISFSTTVQDRLGNQTDEDVMMLSFDLDDLRQARFDNLSSNQVLDLVHSVSIRPAARHAIGQWCVSHEDETPTFCAQALS